LEIAIGWMARGDTGGCREEQSRRYTPRRWIYAWGVTNGGETAAAATTRTGALVLEDGRRARTGPIGDPQWIAGAFLAVWYVNIPPKS
jgi:hypothetical protein